ncbi:immunoglobulin domain-containing protein, partial [Flavobacterium aquidurense]|uniref:immunoglobulin domain-containing protein n=1 Tax=Flavobacterium aquidurense TaxID=362413 RepID=UPI00371CEE73
MRSKITFFLLIILFIWNLTGNKIFAQTISAVATPSTCANNGQITLTGTALPTPIVYGIAKSPYNEPDIISSSSPIFTMLAPGDYFYGYYSGGTFIQSATTVKVVNNYVTTSPTFSNYAPIFYAYCGSTDPLGRIYGTLTGGNAPYTVELINSSSQIVQQLQTSSQISFTGVAAGNYTLRATDNCGTVVLAPNTITLRPNVPYTTFTLPTPSPSPSTSYFNVVFSTPGDVCTPITSASITHFNALLNLTINDITTSGSGPTVPQFYGSKDAVYKLEVQNAAGTFDVYDDLTVAQAYALVAPLPNDRSKWGIIRGTVTLCGITKTNQLDLAQYKEFKQTPLSFVSLSIYDDPTPAPCVLPTQVQLTTSTYQSGGCQPITLDITEKGTSNTQHFVLPQNFSVKLDIGKTYVVVIKDGTGQVLPTYTFKNLTTSTSAKPPQTDPDNLFIDPATFTPLAIKDKIVFTDGISSKYIGKSALVISNLTTALGLVAPIRVQSLSGPSVINKTYTPTSTSYYLGVGNDLIPGTYKIRITDNQCFSADYDIVLGSYITSVALQNVSYDPSPTTCDRYIKKGEIRVTAVGKSLPTTGVDVITTVFLPDYAYPRLLKMPAGATYTNSTSSNFTLRGDATIPFTFTADISGSYEMALSRQNDGRLVFASEIFENTTSVPLEVVPNFPSFDLAQSGGVICPGNTTGSLTVKVNNTVGTVNYFIKKDTDADFPATGQTSTTFTGLTAGNYVVKAKTNCFEVIQPFTLKPATEVGDIVVGDNAFCTGGTLNLSTIALGPVTSIVWTLPDNSTVSTPNLNISNLTTANNGEYKVHVVTAAGCIFDGSIIVTVNPNGEVALPVFNAFSPPLLCQSNTAQQIDYTATATNASSITYTISPAQAGTIGVNGQPATVEWNPAFSGTATITATASGCGLPKSTDFIVVVNPRSTAADIISEGRTICPDQTGIILNALAPTLSNPIFTWYDSNLSSASVLGTGENLIVSPTATTTYYVGVEADDLCINDAGNRKEVTVTVNPLATVGDINVSDEIICQGETATLTATSLLTNPSFKWYTDAALTNLISNTETLNVTPAVTTTYYVTVEADGICAIPPPAKEVTVTVNPLPTAQIAYSSNNFCNRGIAEVTRTGTPDGTYSSDAGLAINSASGEINLATSAAGNHIITYTFIEGTCTNTATASITIYATTLPTPLQAVTAECSVENITAPTLTDYCAGEITAVTNQSFPITTQGETDVNWLFDYGGGYTQIVVQKVIIKDVTRPIRPVLPPIIEECSATLIAPTTTDNCTGIITGTTPTLSPITAQGITSVIWTFNDGNGNSITATQIVIIDDTTAPVTALLDDVTGECSVTPPTPTTTDNCDPGTITGTTETIFPITKTGKTTVIWKFADSSGNYSTAPQDIYVTDSSAPIPPVLSDISGQCSVTPPTPTATDNCAGIVTGTTNTLFPVTAVGTTPVTWLFEDGNGNSVTAIQNIIISNVGLAGTVSTACASDGSGYVLTLNVSGEAPYTATGTGAPGTWSGTTWTSGAIPAGTNYNVSIQDVYACNTLVVSAAAPICCLFDVVCPTFPATTITCYNQLPTATTLTEAEFEALGNGDGTIGNIPCGVIEITASNGTNPGCNGNITRTYTVTEYADPNNNGVRDAGENTILNTSICTQTITIERADFTMPPNDGKTVACPADVVAPTVPVVTDNCGNILTPSTPIVPPFPACNGDVPYTYTFTDCEGNTHNWVYTYTINRANFTMPANQGSTVACAASIVAPTVPVVTDNCGNTLTPSAPVISTTPACNGDVTYTYIFTDCTGNTHDWVYTYTIERLDFIMPANQGSTVACSSFIVAPTVPVVIDNCGNTLTPSAPVISTTPACNGDVTYKYTFTDCTGNTHDWVYTYTIERLDFTMPANQGSTVACAASMVFPILPVITDNCGNILTPSIPAVSPTPCNGDVTYTYTYTDCIGNKHDWVYTYTIERLDFTMPANQGSTVACAASIVAPTVPVVTDNCGNTLTPSAPVISTTPACNGDVTYKYTFTDCAGNTHDWIY